MTSFIVALFIIMGFVFIIVELFFIPGFSVPGLAGLAMIGYGIFKARMAYGTTGAGVAIALCAICSFIIVRMALKSRALKKIGLDYDVGDAKAIDDYSMLIGKTGIAASSLRPSGTAMIDDKRYDVVTEGEFIEKDSQLHVRLVDGTRIVVSSRDTGVA